MTPRLAVSEPPSYYQAKATVFGQILFVPRRKVAYPFRFMLPRVAREFPAFASSLSIARPRHSHYMPTMLPTTTQTFHVCSHNVPTMFPLMPEPFQRCARDIPTTCPRLSRYSLAPSRKRLVAYPPSSRFTLSPRNVALIRGSFPAGPKATVGQTCAHVSEFRRKHSSPGAQTK